MVQICFSPELTPQGLAGLKGTVLKGCCWELYAMPGYLASRGEMRLDYLEHSYSEVLLKYDRDREGF